MNDNNLKSVSDQFVSFATTPNNRTKVMFKQASDRGNANLIIFREDEDENDTGGVVPEERNILFALDDL